MGGGVLTLFPRADFFLASNVSLKPVFVHWGKQNVVCMFPPRDQTVALKGSLWSGKWPGGTCYEHRIRNSKAAIYQ